MDKNILNLLQKDDLNEKITTTFYITIYENG